MKKDITDYLENHVLLMDGAMGTYYNQLYPYEKEAEEANLLKGDQITAIHKEYIKAGANMIRTNTFAVNHEWFPKQEQMQLQIQAAVDNARKAVRELSKEEYPVEGEQSFDPEHDIIIGASIGPIRQDEQFSEEQVMEEYIRIIHIFLEADIHTFVLETFAEIDVLTGVAKEIKKRDEKAFIIGEMSVNPTGYTKYGYSIQRIVSRLGKNPDLDVFGLNCGIGATHISQMLENIIFPKECLFSVLPNAGYQQELRGRLHYSDNPSYYAHHMEAVLKKGANIIGGCCGTTPDHIAALKKMLTLNLNTSVPVAQQYPKKIGKEIRKKYHDKELSPFIEKLEMGKEKLFVVELDSPFKADADKFRKGAFALKDNSVDMITVSDSPMARARADSFSMAVYLKDKVGVPVMPHIACRDRNLIGLRSSILGAHLNEIRNMLIITGDPVAREDRNSITGVFDANSIRLMEYVKNMNEELFGAEPMYYGGALNYAGVNVEAIVNRMEKKIAAGCSYFLTQPVFSDEDINRISYLKQRVNTKIFVGLMPLVSYKNAMFMHNEMPGIQVPDEILTQYRADMTREEAEEVAISVSVSIAKKAYKMADGFYIMTPFHRVNLVNRIINEIRKIK